VQWGREANWEVQAANCLLKQILTTAGVHRMSTTQQDFLEKMIGGATKKGKLSSEQQSTAQIGGMNQGEGV